MIVNNFDILEVRLVKVDSKTNDATFKVICSDDKNPLTLNLSLEKGMEQTARELVQKVKNSRRREDTQREGPLAGLSIANVMNDEEVIENIVKGLIRTDQKVTNLKRVRVASEYMKLFDQLSTMQEVLYKKTGYGPSA